jgi:replication-associated recombination protein RarA
MGMGQKQMDLFGQTVFKEPEPESEEASILKSALQKCIRQGQAEKAMYMALQLLKKGGWYNCWRRLRIMAVEDCGQPEVITAVETLYKQFLEMKGKEGDGTSWDCQRTVAAAAKILAESPKDRRADEILELLWAYEQCPDDPELKKMVEELAEIPDDAYDGHTLKGRKMGRGLLHWYERASQTTNRTAEYANWRQRFEQLMIRLSREKKIKWD